MYSLKLYRMFKKEKEQLSKKSNYTAAIAVAYRDHVVEHASRPNQASVHTSTPLLSIKGSGLNKWRYFQVVRAVRLDQSYLA